MTVNSDIFKIGIVFLILGALLMGFVYGLKKMFANSKRKFFIYIFITFLLFGLSGFLSNGKVLNDIPLNNFISFQVVFCVLGILHVIAVRNFFIELKEKRTSFWTEFLFTVIVGGVGLIAFMFINNLYKPLYTYIFTAAIICFLLPFLVVKLYEFSIAVPVPVYKKWFYPVDRVMSPPKGDELDNLHVIYFEFYKNNNSNEFSRFSLKAPAKMTFGRLFYIFINDYNDNHPEGLINYLNQHNNPVGWVFHTKPSWFGWRRHIDFDKTIEMNKIKEKDVIVCHRIY